MGQASPALLEQILSRAAGIAQVDPDGRYLFVTDRYCDMLGRSRDDLLAAKIQDFAHPDDLPRTLDSLIRAMESDVAERVEHRVVRADGSFVWLSNSVAAVRDAQGNPQYVVAVATAYEQAAATRRDGRGEGELRLILDAAAGGLCCLDRDATVTMCNAGFLRMLGAAREQDIAGKTLHELVHRGPGEPEAHAPDQCPIDNAARSGTPAHVAEEAFRRLDGTSFPAEYWVRPTFHGGEIHGAICTFVDLTERKAAETRQQVMNQELAHRVKNTLAMVQAIVSQTLRNTPDREQAVRAINQRLVALGNAHTALTGTRWGSASIMDVIEGAIAVHRAAGDRIEVDGPRIDLGSKAALAISLALHELCTNAAKYGALSSDRGRVAIKWTVTGGAADAAFALRWQERDGPPVSPPVRKGFGSKLIAEAVGADLGGKVQLAFDPAGVSWSLEAPLAAVKR